MQSCSTIFDVSAISSSLGNSSPPDLETCQTIKKIDKNSLHVPIDVCDRRIFALVDIGATSYFFKFLLAKKLKVWDKKTKSIHQVRYANGVMELLLGIVPLKITLKAQCTIVPTYILHGKGPSLILGFTFLEQQELLVDCGGCHPRVLFIATPLHCSPGLLSSL